MAVDRRRDVVVVAGGPTPPVPAADVDGWVVVAADSGLRAVLAAGLVPDVVVGDLDSVDPVDLASARAAGARIDRHPVEKDATDLELALDVAAALDPRHVLVIAGLGGRADHALAGALLLAAPRYAAIPRLDARLDGALVQVVRSGGRAEVHGAAGAIVSILAVGGPATGVTTTGLRYALHGEVLHPGSTRGVSNEIAGGDGVAEVAIGEGTVLVIRPDPSGR